jgi:hypothetical protein
MTNDIIADYIRTKAAARGHRRPELAADLLKGQKLHTAAEVDQALAALEQRHGDALVEKQAEQAPPSEAERLHRLVASRPRSQAEHDQLIAEQAKLVEAHRVLDVINEARARERGM